MNSVTNSTRLAEKLQKSKRTTKLQKEKQNGLKIK